MRSTRTITPGYPSVANADAPYAQRGNVGHRHCAGGPEQQVERFGRDDVPINKQITVAFNAEFGLGRAAPIGLVDGSSSGS